MLDILLAMTLGVVFVVIITQSSLSSRDIYEFAKERSRLIDVYSNYSNEFQEMMPYETRTITFDPDGWKYSTTTIAANAQWYGNDRVQTNITVSTSIDSYSGNNFVSTSSRTSRTFRNQSVTFNSIRSYRFLNINDTAGTPLCSVDFTNKSTVGSYSWPTNTSSVDPKITPIILPIDPLLRLTDFQVRSGKAYISSDSTKSSDPDLLIVDISNSSSAIQISDVNTGPGVSSLALVGDRMFASVTSRIAQLHSIKIQSSKSLILESTFKIPLPYATATPSLGSTIFYNKNNVYLGTEKWDGEEFSIIDVSNPTKPIKVGGVEIGSKVGSIFVRNGIAYISASNEKQLMVVDVSNPTTPIVLDSFGPTGWERQEGKTLSFFEDAIGFGRTSGGFNIKSDHELFHWNISTSTNYQNYNMSLANSVDISGGVYGIIVDRSHVYLATRQLDREFQIFDRNLSTSTVQTISLPVAPQAMTCDGDSIYILASMAPVIYKITF